MIRLGTLFASTSATFGLLSNNSISFPGELTTEEADSEALGAAFVWQPANTNGTNKTMAAILGTENLLTFLFICNSFPPPIKIYL